MKILTTAAQLAAARMAESRKDCGTVFSETLRNPTPRSTPTNVAIIATSI
jgi:hypothetical protein